jgi:hypothetical protein
MLPLILLLVAPPIVPPASEGVPLLHAHAHNDYAHPKPLLDALSHGFTSVEADIFLWREQLHIGHHWFELRTKRTLETLYLEPLRQRMKANKGQIFGPDTPFWFLIDLKTEAKTTYEALDALLRRYDDLISEVNEGKVIERAVRVVVTGNYPREVIQKQKRRMVAMDGRLSDLDSDAPEHLIAWISSSWGSSFRWRGEGEFPEAERKKLTTLLTKAHHAKRQVRFWAAPDTPKVWHELRRLGVDRINTDRLAEFAKEFAKGGHPRR